MTADELHRLRRFRETLHAHYSYLDNERLRMVRTGPTGTAVTQNLLASLSNEFPDLFDFVTYRGTDFEHIREAKPLIGMALAAVENELTAATVSAPTRLFPFVKDAKLRAIVERDDAELAKAMQTQSWKSVLILAGGAIEGVLLDLLSQPQNETNAMAKAPTDRNKGTKKALDEWDLGHLIDVAHALVLTKPNIKSFAHGVREYRNLVHPGLEKRSKLEATELEARAATTVLDMLHAAMA